MKRIFIFLMVSFPVFLKAATISITGGSGGGGSGTITSVNAGSGLTGGGSSGSVTLNVDSTAVDVLASTQTVSGQKTFTSTTVFSGAVVNMNTSDTDGATITFNLSQTNYHSVTLGGNRTLAISNPLLHESFTIQLIQDATGSRTVTWFSGILWPAGIVPTLTTTPGKRDVFTFRCIGSGVYLGFVNGQNF